MIYVFEGPRNSGKTFLSNYISTKFHIKRFQFAFADFFRVLGLQSQNSKEAHAFSMGKELMIMQLFKDIDFEKGVIHDRGMLTVLAWGIMEGRITEEEMESQVRMIKDFGLMENVSIVFVNGDNPNKSDRNKDQWDRIDGDTREFECYQKVIRKFQEYGIGKISMFQNSFDEQSLSNITNLFEDLILS
jgi:hypothetical protein